MTQLDSLPLLYERFNIRFLESQTSLVDPVKGNCPPFSPFENGGRTYLEQIGYLFSG